MRDGRIDLEISVCLMPIEKVDSALKVCFNTNLIFIQLKKLMYIISFKVNKNNFA